MRLTGGEIVVEYLIRQGVPYICGKEYEKGRAEEKL